MDVTLRSDQIPDEPIEVRKWLSDQGNTIKKVLEKLADDFSAGTDFSPPFRREFSTDKISGQVAFSSMRRVQCLQMAQVFRDIAKNWKRYVNQLEEWSDPVVTTR